MNNPQPKKVVIVAGEESGDAHAATLASKLLAWDPTLELSGIGGRHMQQAGVNVISDLASFGVTGITEVVRYFMVIKKAWKLIKNHLQTVQPDLLILIDYPGFNLRLARFAKRVLGLRIVYYISPQIWAWKANRIHTIRECVDHMAVILPFEKSLYQQENVTVSFVGHPLVNKIPLYDNLASVRMSLNLPLDKRLIALLPGSRRNEIDRHMPVLLKTAEQLCRQFSDVHFVIPIAATIDASLIRSYFTHSQVPVSFIEGQAIDAAACSDCVVVASGTASLECALLAKPMCIIYKASLLTYIAATKLIKVKYLGLCNLLKNQMIVPELLQYDCNPTQLARLIDDLLHDHDMAGAMVHRLQVLKRELSSEQADLSIDELIKEELSI
ncbi:lipid-A-disaccharide synthase [Legionella taurinensis]|uniref:Lipid-A-disaccharide synthase n=1 Tax=Legionella taurinensis TaxID=70611 RepID=A0AB38N564_9GAMM|nr:lipid-A-disaccharide synthase [Legionella taurinensis]MDX1836808.1 lipid-A-disaccharide synthase [Legionella taurinensis]PUT41226.1 lipid-A-disaccharide synthase [Legionella taurinensis]PUT42351.1 lipid-A-disaccharide synthase [Legionella taurinensis]PUT43876.1 lipid-A-disaccharide synthase [Legionella taurinensis]PUT47132.1 lipid-A-disaccharide synthase [Legionella taurinensis]